MDLQNKDVLFVLPPPNVTGNLHIGHALVITFQDIQARFLQLHGTKVDWIPGTDHAGIATQLIAERALNAEGKQRKDLSDEEFLKYIWGIKDKHEGSIINQVKQMNTIINWDRYCFTMDEHSNKMVLDAFIKLYEKGLVFKAKRFVYWDTKLQTAYSDLEVNFKTIKGKFYYVKYKLVDEDGYVTVATTRPETIFGDVALCVNPDDEALQHLVGKKAIVPMVNREVQIIADESIEIGKGTGVLKVTPMHDLLDAELGKRYDLENIQVIDKCGKLINVPKEFENLTVEEAKVKVEQVLEELGLLEKVEQIEHNVPHGEKSGVRLELLQTEQWFIKMEGLAQKALDAVKDGKVKLVPESFVKIYNHWLENIEPWCVSRQILWGHRIPVWYGPDGKELVAYTEQEAYNKAKEHYGKEVELKQETDVLDTWFSSALWAYSTQKDEMKLPMSFLVTGKDILFFWVARMIMMTLEMYDQVPFNEVFLHGLVLDKHGKKMSKMVGNVVNPLDLIEKYNSDILKMALVVHAYPGKDIRFNEKDLELARNFLTKVKNACVFAKNVGVDQSNVRRQTIWGSWIMGKCNQLMQEVKQDMLSWNMAVGLQKIEQFVRDDLCAWFLEYVKLSEEQADRDAMGYCLHAVLNLLYPYAPEFCLGQYDELFAKEWQLLQEIKAEKDYKQVLEMQEIITKARSVYKLELAKEIIVDDMYDMEFLSKFARIKFLHAVDKTGYRKYSKLYIKPELDVDLSAIRRKLEKEIQEHQKLITSAQDRLSNEQFMVNVSEDLKQEMVERIEVNQILLADKQELLSVL